MRRARKSIANFKLREGMPVGVSVTLRGARMWEFLDRLITIAIPRIRDFRGLDPRSFDGRGNYSMGVREQLIFPEIDYDSIDEVRGLDIAITTTAATDEEGFELLLGARDAVLGRAPPGGRRARGRPGGGAPATRRRVLRAEAEQAALEQLKEENPEAYAKPERHEEGEEGEEGEGEGPRRRVFKRGKFRGVDGKDVTARAPESANAEVQDPRLQPLPSLRPLARLLP